MQKLRKRNIYIKRTKISANGQVPIYMRITIDGKRIDKSTGRSVDLNRWIVNAGKTKGNNEVTKEINNYLDVLRAQVYDYRTELIRTSTSVGYENIKNKVLGIEERPISLIEIFQLVIFFTDDILSSSNFPQRNFLRDLSNS